MKPAIDALKKTFREGRHAEAIAQCEALSSTEPGNLDLKRLCATMNAVAGRYARSLELLHEVRDPDKEDPDILFNIALCERQLNNFQSAERFFAIFTDKFPKDPGGWARRAECRFRLNGFEEALRLADRAIELDASSLEAWTVRGNGQHSLGRFEEAQASLTRAIQLAPDLAPLRAARADAFQAAGRMQEAAADYRAALSLAPADAQTLKKATLCLLEQGLGEQALDLCRDLLKVQPDNLTARLGAEWVLSQLVPLWHIPMMNEQERNQAYHDGLAAVVAPDKLVFEIGTGSGLVSMMAAKLGARQVVTCEAVGLVARTARKIIERNGLKDRITVLAKPSQAVRIGEDLPAQADILVHEIFSSELLGEHVLPAIEDARRRLLRPGGIVLPAAASIMVALVGGDDLARTIHAGESFGFDLRDFNAINAKKRPLYREDLSPVLMSEPAEAFRFDFQRDSTFPAESKRLEIAATRAGRCYGLIQWIRIDMAEGVRFENHPSQRRALANWQHATFGFDEPIELAEGRRVAIAATHDRARPWFALATGS